MFDFSEECNDRGGTSSGSCANGFGVCCVSEYSFLVIFFCLAQHIFLVTLNRCGVTSSENNTYLINPGTIPEDCTYRICPSSGNICRIRYDFNVSLFLTDYR